MKIRQLVFCATLFICTSGVVAQQVMTLPLYIETYKEIAMEEMRTHGIPASIKLGQGILESGFGNSDLAVEANNHFGIKCHGWRGNTFYKDDDEENECFRAYDNPLQSFRDHSEFLTTRPRYAGLFELEITDYKAWARGLRRAGYATNPRYPELLIGVIERNQLYKFDQKVVSGGYTRPARETPAPVAQQRPARRSGTDFPDIGVGREVHENNRIRYVYARRGDTPESIAQEMGMWAREIYRYNDLENGDQLQVGQIVYLQPKRRRSSQNYHRVQPGETMYDISQKYGVRLQRLYRRNNLEEGTDPEVGSRIYLRGRARN